MTMILALVARLSATLDSMRVSLGGPVPPFEAATVTVRTVEQGQAAARTEYRRVAGRILGVRHVSGYVGDVVVDRAAPPDDLFRVRVKPTDDADLVRMTDRAFIDPCWSIEPIPGETRLTDLRSLWTYGTSYSLPASTVSASR